ncbi:MAG: TIGR00645 family protein [Rickettsiales bacterium]|jgi:uncharacterized protein (TIGR00645 family)|nr:TIGR00645 family protein [Rickettsiales bacterium]
MKKNNIIEKCIEHGLFASRWLMAPFYIGLALSLALLMFSFIEELWHLLLTINDLSQTDVILGALSLIDLSLAGNLVLIVIFSGYENFVSKFEIDNLDQPDWKGSIDFSTLKLKLISSMVAISGVQLLKIFMSDKPLNPSQFKWLLITHFLFIVSGVFLSITDFISAKTKTLKIKGQ